MVATWCLLGCMLTHGQAPERLAPPGPPPYARPARGSWQLGVRLEPAQELVYRGTYQEESRLDQVHFRRGYRMELHLFVLAGSPRGAEVAVMTTLKHLEPRPGAGAGPGDAASVRLETIQVDTRGRVKADPALSLQVALDAVPTLEVGAFLPLPVEGVVQDQAWEVYELGRPAQVWHIGGVEMVHGTRCLVLEGVQQSPEWEQPRADQSAWRRRDRVWLAEQQGHAVRVERTIERREPARTETTYRSVLRYDLESSLRYPGQLFADRRDEIRLAGQLVRESEPLLLRPAQHGPQLETALTRIKYHLDRNPPTPYRQALVHVQQRVEAARRGEAPVVLTSAKAGPPRVATEGQAAPDFATTSFTGPGATLRLQSLLGRPVLMIFYQPGSATTASLLPFAQALHASLPDQVRVVGLPVSDSRQEVLAQRDELKLTFPLVSGSGLRTSYAVQNTPTIVLLDANGIVRASFVGWGQEIPTAVSAELRRWLPGR